MYQVNLLNEAKRNLRKLDKRFQDKVLSSLLLLKDNPFLGEKMGGNFKDQYRIKIPPIRVIYTIDQKSKTIYITALGHRGDIYK